MLLNCSSCNTSYLVNSADLQPNGRTVECANCSNQWFQKANIENQDSIFLRIKRDENLKNDNNQNKEDYEKNLPSKYVEPPKPSIFNSFLIIFFLFFIIFLYFYLKNLEGGIIHLIKYYMEEIKLLISIIIQNLANFFYDLLN